MTFHHKNMFVDNSNIGLAIDNNTTEHVIQFKLLGIWLDNDLTFTTH